MSTDGAQLTFSELLQRHGRVEVPLIQRDYAQGREDQEEVREEFLRALHEALSRQPDDPLLPLNLDFVYGSVSDEVGSPFNPLDGQQRLTTLFLLHWYLAWLDGCEDKFRNLCVDDSRSRFGYQVRPSSSEFFNALAGFFPEELPSLVNSVSALIEDQPWFFRNWRLDPTIQASLVMMDAIHKWFGTTEGLYSRLTDIERPAITFQLLDLMNFGLSDDLYIKMNARGKPLTAFETFKARYEQSLRELYPNETQSLNGQEVSIAEFFSRRMDTRWSDFFWPYRDPDSHLFDNAVMNVFRAVLATTRNPESEGFVDDITKLRSRLSKSTYAFFAQKDWLDKAFSRRLMTLLEVWSGSPSGFQNSLPDARYFDELSVFEKACESPTDLGYEELIQFAAYGQYLEHHSENIDSDVFQAWMRTVFNLTVNTEYNRPADMQRSLESIHELAPHMTTILEHLASADESVSGFSREQVAEERIKARLMLAHDSWQPLIEAAENHPYFRGQIGFLLVYSGIEFDASLQDIQAWSGDTISRLQDSFSDYLGKATRMFDRAGLLRLDNALWERALLSLGDYLLPARRNHSFLVNLRTDQASWKRLLRGAVHGSSQGHVLQSLWQRLDLEKDLSSQLTQIIQDSRVSECWRSALIGEPRAIEYCRSRMIRFGDYGKVYLLKRTQMNGSHAELFSYCFFEQVLEPAKEDGELNQLDLSYLETMTSDEEPGVSLTFYMGGALKTFFFERLLDGYLLSIEGGDKLPDELAAALKDLEFSENQGLFTRECSYNEASSLIWSLDARLAELAKEGFK